MERQLSTSKNEEISVTLEEIDDYLLHQIEALTEQYPGIVLAID